MWDFARNIKHFRQNVKHSKKFLQLSVPGSWRLFAQNILHTHYMPQRTKLARTSHVARRYRAGLRPLVIEYVQPVLPRGHNIQAAKASEVSHCEVYSTPGTNSDRPVIHYLLRK